MKASYVSEFLFVLVVSNTAEGQILSFIVGLPLFAVLYSIHDNAAFCSCYYYCTYDCTPSLYSLLKLHPYVLS